MAVEDDIRYAGPDLTFHPGIGASYPVDKQVFTSPGEDSYADIDKLDRTLDFIINQAATFTSMLEADLVLFVLPIPAGDTRLSQALTSEWPSQLGDNNGKITYR